MLGASLAAGDAGCGSMLTINCLRDSTMNFRTVFTSIVSFFSFPQGSGCLKINVSLPLDELLSHTEEVHLPEATNFKALVIRLSQSKLFSKAYINK